jgi:type IV fimbrial biogenesis protein FimT
MLIVGIIAAIGLPTFKYVTGANRMATEVNALLGDMQYARSEAVKEGQFVVVCASNVAAAGTQGGCSGSGSWASGWIVFADVNNNQTFNTGSDILLRVQPGFTGTDTFVGDNSLSAASFNREGFLSVYAGTSLQTLPLNVTLHSSPTNSAWTRCLALSFAGLPITEASGVGTPTCS